MVSCWCRFWCWNLVYSSKILLVLTGNMNTLYEYSVCSGSLLTLTINLFSVQPRYNTFIKWFSWTVTHAIAILIVVFQIEFLTKSNIVYMATQGRAFAPPNCCDQWLTDFTVEISSDCSLFVYLKDDAGQNRVTYSIANDLNMTSIFITHIDIKSNLVNFKNTFFIKVVVI